MDKGQLAQLVREKRTAKGITQQELADLAGISLRSVQRMENGEVLPRSYTLRVIAEKLGFDFPPTIEDSTTPGEDLGAGQTNAAQVMAQVKPAKHLPTRPGMNRPRKLILTFGIGLIILLGTAAYISQSAHFPETDFERFLLWGAVISVYTCILIGCGSKERCHKSCRLL
jgi:transcriptional regulator with XRE-family HTH domain